MVILNREYIKIKFHNKMEDDILMDSFNLLIKKIIDDFIKTKKFY